MYWIYFIVFILAVFVPDIIKNDFHSISNTRLQEIAIFFLAMVGFLFFIFEEQKNKVQEKEKEKNLRQLENTSRDLVESYSYIGEVNRKMDILLQIALGVLDRSVLDKNKEKEIYHDIINAANFLMKADCSCLRFLELTTKKIKKEVRTCTGHCLIKSSDLLENGDGINYKKSDGLLIITSSQKINNVKSFLLVKGFDKDEENAPKNLEILRVLASQALFIYSYMAGNSNNK